MRAARARGAGESARRRRDIDRVTDRRDRGSTRQSACAHWRAHDRTVEIHSGLLPVVDRLGQRSYAPRPLCQNLGAKPGPFRVPPIAANCRSVPARDARADAASTARDTTDRCTGLRSRAHAIHALALPANFEASVPRDAARIGYRTHATTSWSVRARHHPTLIPIPRLRFIGPLPPSSDRASVLEADPARRSGRATRVCACACRAVRDESGLRLHGRSDNPCS